VRGFVSPPICESLSRDAGHDLVGAFLMEDDGDYDGGVPGDAHGPKHKGGRLPSMADRIFLRLDEKSALGADDLQWIVYTSRTKVPPPSLESKHWRPDSFVRSTKAILMRCIGGGLTDTARLALEGYPDTFDAWKAAVSAQGTAAMAPEPELERS